VAAPRGIDAEQHFFAVADPLVLSSLCAFLDIESLRAVPLAIRSLQAEAFLELQLQVVQQLLTGDEGIRDRKVVRDVASIGLRLLRSPRLSLHVPALLPMLKHDDEFVRRGALYALCGLDSALLAEHVPEVLRMLGGDTSMDVLEQAVATLDQLDDVDIAPHVPALMQAYSCADMNHEEYVEEALTNVPRAVLALHASHVSSLLLLGRGDSCARFAMTTLAEMGSAYLAPHVHTLLDLPDGDGDCDGDMREAAFDTLAKLDPSVLAEHVEALMGGFSDVEEEVRLSALIALQTLSSDLLAPHLRILLDALEDGGSYVRSCTMELLGSLDAALLGQQLPVVLRWLFAGGGDDDDATDVRRVAWETLSKLDSAQLAGQIPALLGCVPDASDRVTFAALSTLGKLDAAVLVEHVPRLLQLLATGDADTRCFVLKKLGEMDAAALGQHAQALVRVLVDGNWAPVPPESGQVEW